MKPVEVKGPRPTLKLVRAETVSLFSDLIAFQIGIERALRNAASDEKGAIEDHIDYFERNLLLEPEEYEPVQVARRKTHHQKYNVSPSPVGRRACLDRAGSRETDAAEW